MKEPPASALCFSAPASRLFRWCARVLALTVFSAALAHAAQTDDTPAKRVLLISTGSRLAPGFILVDQQIVRALAATPSPRIDTYAENIDVVRFPDERTQRIFGEY